MSKPKIPYTKRTRTLGQKPETEFTPAPPKPASVLLSFHNERINEIKAENEEHVNLLLSDIKSLSKKLKDATFNWKWWRLAAFISMIIQIVTIILSHTK